jgi:phosphoglycolate phosphatase
MTGKLVVFDVDGTLVDSRAILMHTAQTAFAELGLTPPTYDELRQIVGLSLYEGLAQLAPDLTTEQVEALVALYKSIFSSLRSRPGFIEPLYEGAAVLLERLKAEGWRMALATGKSRRGVNTIVEMHRWADLFHSTHCADDGPGKPHPAMLIEAMRALDAAREDTVMIGDTSHDIRMAQAAGVRAVGVSWGFHTREELEACRPDYIADTFAELDAELDRFGVFPTRRAGQR